MITLEIDASGPIAALRVIGGNVGDMTAPSDRVLTSALVDAQENIESSGGMFGGWADMSPFTPIVAQAFGRSRVPGTLLHDSGGLIQSFEKGDAGNIFEAGPAGGQAGSSYERDGFPVAAAQQAGTDRTFHVLQGAGFSEPGIPGRMMLTWREDRLPEYDEIFADHLFKGVAGEA